MQLLVYLLAYPFLWLISRLPFSILYFISDGVFILLYHLVGYRKKVVYENLKLVFPEKSEKEILRTQKKFFRHMCDIFLEMIKTLGISTAEMQKRFDFTNIEVLHQLQDQGKNTIVMLPHYASWEWVLSLNAQVQYAGYGIYQKVQNKYFDKLVRDIRSKFGTTLIRTNESRKILKEVKKSGQLFTVGIISDQSPMASRARHWAKFMGIMVPVHIGGEELAKDLNLVPVYIKIAQVKRGYYQATFKILAKEPRKVPNYDITATFMKEVEDSIRQAPEYYFWTHKRWKHRDKVPEAYLNNVGSDA
ncbi:MAG: lipid A biosynthesis acyltransferase [Croceitalea sp.]|nr:lipid A biosynthesis acyltransferase [Croceitalea sp.]